MARSVGEGWTWARALGARVRGSARARVCLFVCLRERDRRERERVSERETDEMGSVGGRKAVTK